ncbi:unnamed protein product [Cuscuta epithymum]|uniref:Uncharacterized protein n=2 Tax=Cuscuta epithymum TaxID=186058 RepID=A0AAV0EK04_9ASTE|nr:unnamed protein product [Cuscuta epithymum]
MSENPATMADEVWAARSNSFFKALQELKNLRPQLDSAAECSEKSYHYSNQKEMAMDNLKEYAERAVVSAIDHIGTVAYKLNEMLEEETSDISTMELMVTRFHQQIFTCQTYIDKEGLRQQKLLATNPRLHKHYTLPASAVRKKVDSSQEHIQKSQTQHKDTRPQICLLGAPAPKTLSWHLALEAKSKLRRPSQFLTRDEDAMMSGRTSGVGRTSSDVGEEMRTKKIPSSSTRPRSLGAGPASRVAMQTLGIDASEGYKLRTTRPNPPPFGNRTHEEKAAKVASTRGKATAAALSTTFSAVKEKTRKLIKSIQTSEY